MKLTHKPRGTLVAALDIGSHKVACIIGRVIDDEGGIEVLGAGYQAAKGIKGGVITDLELADHSIRQSVHAAEKMASHEINGYPLRDVIVNVPATQTRSESLDISLQISGQAVAQYDIDQALSNAQNQITKTDKELIHTIMVNCGIDGVAGIDDPINMTGQSLDVSVNAVLSALTPLQNLTNCIERGHLDIICLCSSVYAAGLSCLVEDEMNLGCTVIDMGAGATSFAIFMGGKMIHQDYIPIGSGHVTSDIANGLNCSMTDAERIKTLYGSAMLGTSDENELIDVPRLGETDSTTANHVSRALLIGIIQPRIEEILEMVREKLDASEFRELIGRKVVLTGGGSQLSGLRELSKLILDKQVRLGRPIRISGLPDAVSGPNFASVSGLLVYYVSHSHEMPTEVSANADSGSLWSRIKNWWKENW
jgi:cell division protein FtsA